MSDITREDLIEVLGSCYSDLEFTYQGKKCGVVPEVEDSIPTYLAWYGTEEKTFTNLTDLLHSPFFGGKSLIDLVGKVNYFFC